MKLAIFSAECESAERIARTVRSMGWSVSTVSALDELAPELDVLILDGFAPETVATMLSDRFGTGGPRPLVMAGASDMATEFGDPLLTEVDDWYWSGSTKSLTFRIQILARRIRERHALANAELRLEQANETIYTVDFQGRFTAANAAAERLTGFSREQLIGMPMADLIVPEDFDRARRHIAEKLAGNEASSVFEVAITRVDGTRRLLEISSRLYFEGTVPMGIQGIARDITEQRDLENRLSGLAAIVESSRFAVVGRDLDGTITSWNSAAERLTGWTREEAIGTMMLNLIPERLEETTPDRLATLNSPQPTEIETVRTRKDGTEFPVRLSTFPVFDATGRVIGSATLGYDLSEEAARKQALIATEERYRTAADGSLDSIFILEAVRDASGAIHDFKFVDMNKAAEQMITVPRVDAIGGLLCELIPVNRSDGFFEKYVAVVETGEQLDEEFSIASSEITAKWIHHTVVKFGDGIFITSRDISERKRMAAALAMREAHLSAVFGSIDEGITLIDRDKRFVLGNRLAIQRMESASGITPEPGGDIRDYIYAANREAFDAAFAGALEGKHSVNKGRHIDRETGEPVWMAYSLHPVRDEKGFVTSVAEVSRDITSTEKAERALREATRNHRAIVENTPDALFVLDVEQDMGDQVFRVAMVNTAFSRLTGLSLDRIQGRRIDDVFTSSSVLRAALDRYNQAIEARSTIEYEEVVPYGLAPSVLTNLTPLFDESGRCYRLIGSSRDITERVRLAAEERSARAEAERLALIVESAGDAIVSVDLEGRITSWNPGAERLFGYAAGEALGRESSFVFPFDSDPAEAVASEARLTAVLQGATILGVQTRRRRKDGEIVDILTTSFPLRDLEGNLIGGASTATDVTELRRAEEAVRETAAELDAVFASSTDVYVLLDTEARIVRLNPPALHDLRRAHGHIDFLGKPWQRFMPAAGRSEFDAHFSRSLQGEAVRFERFAPIGNEERWFEVNYSPVRMEGGHIRGVLIGGRDITERRRTSEALLQAQKLESLAILAGGIAHDFNNLLVGILGNAGLALSELSPTSPARPTIESIEVAGQRAADLARQMLAYSGRGTFVVKDADLNELVREMTHLLRVSIGKRVQLQLDLAGSLPQVQADATQLRQVVMNLVVNASDAIGDDNGVISVSTSAIQATRELLAESYLAPDLEPGLYVAVEVSDTGAGMDSTTLARIFDPFFTTKFTGRGLGLAAVLGIMRGHKGAIQVVSEPGRGSTFRLLFPATVSSYPSDSEAVAPKTWRGSGTVLVVDDEPTVRSVTARALRSFGFETIEAEDGIAGLEAYRENSEQIVCVLLDMTMPRMNGEETFGEIRKLNPEAKILLMSGYTEQDATHHFIGRGLAGFVQKPYELSVLRGAVEQILNEGSQP